MDKITQDNDFKLSCMVPYRKFLYLNLELFILSLLMESPKLHKIKNTFHVK